MGTEQPLEVSQTWCGCPGGGQVAGSTGDLPWLLIFTLSWVSQLSLPLTALSFLPVLGDKK